MEEIVKYRLRTRLQVSAKSVWNRHHSKCLALVESMLLLYSKGMQMELFKLIAEWVYFAGRH